MRKNSNVKDYTIYQGSTFKRKIRYQQRKTDSNIIEPVDLTGSAIRMQIRPRIESDQVILDLGLEGYITISDPSNGEITIEIPSSITAGLDFGTAQYDIELEFSDGTVTRFMQGRMSLSKEVTR